MSVLLQCYNQSCQRKFDPNNNEENICQHHPGHPVFHDAQKFWSCCEKKTTDFSTFLATPGCTFGKHSNEKPKKDEIIEEIPIITKEEKTEIIDEMPLTLLSRSSNEIEIISNQKMDIVSNIQISPSYQRIMKNFVTNENLNKSEIDEKLINDETECKRNGCKIKYKERGETCQHHSGIAIFHEGYKYWSCCQRKTTEFEEFVKQIGCEILKDHQWIAQKSVVEKCRKEYHQTGMEINIVFYIRNPIPTKCSILTNSVNVTANMESKDGKKYGEEIQLYDEIDTTKTQIYFAQPKIEVRLMKKNNIQWSRLYR
ncbi:hypothetical protein SNEBB_006853 [Seison nebaliae]|nr:hypothetical protein SNEBB_006853 [Seison nebaliae]